MKPTIEVTIPPKGEILIDAVGFKGVDCEKATKYLEEALGITGTKQKKLDYHQRGRTAQPQKLGS